MQFWQQYHHINLMQFWQQYHHINLMQFWQQYHYLLLATVADAWRVMSTEDERALRWNRLVPLQISVCCEKATAFAYTAIFLRLLITAVVKKEFFHSGVK